jgi:hypothetical protein
MKVILDTGALHNDHWLRGAPVRVLREILRQSGAKLLLPDVVVRELERQYAKQVKQAMSAAQSLNEELLPPNHSKITQLSEPSTWIEAQRREFGERLRWLGAEVLSSETITAASLLERALDGRRPFNGEEGKKGFRDALIWQHVLQVASSCADHIVLVTLNTKDFCGPEGLHSDLREELKQRALAGGSIEVVVGLGAFNRREAAIHLGRLLDIENELQKSKHPSISLASILLANKEIVADELSDDTACEKWAKHLESQWIERREHRTNFRVYGITLDLDAAKIDEIIVTTLDEDDLSIGFTARFAVEVSGLSDAWLYTKHDFEDTDKDEEFSAEVEMSFEVIVNNRAGAEPLFSVTQWHAE